VVAAGSTAHLSLYVQSLSLSLSPSPSLYLCAWAVALFPCIATVTAATSHGDRMCIHCLQPGILTVMLPDRRSFTFWRLLNYLFHRLPIGPSLTGFTQNFNPSFFCRKFHGPNVQFLLSKQRRKCTECVLSRTVYVRFYRAALWQIALLVRPSVIYTMRSVIRLNIVTLCTYTCVVSHPVDSAIRWHIMYDKASYTTREVKWIGVSGMC